jgi:Fic/DOC family
LRFIVPKSLSDTLDSQILQFLAEHSDGAGIDKIEVAFRHLASKRTLQRRLSKFIKTGQVRSTGEARAVRYRRNEIPGSLEASPGAPTANQVGEIHIPISPAGAELRDRVRRERTHREPVGYQREFLDLYRPNETRYLSPDVIDHLRRIGRTSVEDQLAGTYARSIIKRLLIDLSWASSKLEGNTYSLLETERLLELNEAAQGKPAFETQMILNHRNAIEFLIQSATDEDVGVNKQTIRNLHALLADNLLLDPEAVGRLRTGAMGVGGSVYLPLDGGVILSEAFDHLVDTAAAIREPFEQSFFLMVQLPYLQPFDDVNKRVSRLAANIPFIKHNLCPLSFIEVPERAYVDALLAVYELTRIELLRDVFVWAYERSARRYLAVRQSIGEPDPFRLRYREAMISVVGLIVRSNQQPTPEQIRIAAAGQGVASEHTDHFVRLVQQELSSMHDGNFARYRLRPSEFLRWREKSR